MKIAHASLHTSYNIGISNSRTNEAKYRCKNNIWDVYITSPDKRYYKGNIKFIPLFENLNFLLKYQDRNKLFFYLIRIITFNFIMFRIFFNF